MIRKKFWVSKKESFYLIDEPEGFSGMCRYGAFLEGRTVHFVQEFYKNNDPVKSL